MKRKYVLFSCIIAIMILSLSPVYPVSAKAKPGSQSVSASKKMNSRLKGGFDNGKIEQEPIYVLPLERGKTYRAKPTPLERGRKYRLKDFLKQGRNSDCKEDLRDRMKEKPKQKITLSGKDFEIKKQTFRPKREGLYELKVETREVRYIFPIYVIEEIYKIKSDEISRIAIEVNQWGIRYTAVVENIAVIQQIVEKINQAEFTFDPEESKTYRVGDSGFDVIIQWKNGRVTELDTFNGGGFQLKNGWNQPRCCWSCSNKQTAIECVRYIGQVFDECLPRHKGKRSIC